MNSSLNKTVWADPVMIKLPGYLLLLLILFGVKKAVAVPYQVSGNLEYTVGGVNQESNPTARMGFTVAVDGCFWLIRTHNLGENAIKYYETGYDGTNIYSYVRFDDSNWNTNGDSHLMFNPITRRFESIRGAATKQPYNLGTVNIEHNDVPEETGNFTSTIWLAWASECYLQSLSTNRLKPVWHLDDITLRQAAYAVHADWLMDTNAPNLPIQVAYFNDGYLRHHSSYGGSAVDKYPQPFDQGFTDAVYIVTGKTNFANLSMPTKYTFIKYKPHLFDTNGMKKLDTMYVIRTVVTNISITTQVNPLPSLQGITAVNDKRLVTSQTSEVDVVQYDITNWSEINNPKAKLIVLAKDKMVGVTQARESNAWKRQFILCLIGILSIFPIVFLLMQKIGKNRKKN